MYNPPLQTIGSGRKITESGPSVTLGPQVMDRGTYLLYTAVHCYIQLTYVSIEVTLARRYVADARIVR